MMSGLRKEGSLSSHQDTLATGRQLQDLTLLKQQDEDDSDVNNKMGFLIIILWVFVISLIICAYYNHKHGCCCYKEKERKERAAAWGKQQDNVSYARKKPTVDYRQYLDPENPITSSKSRNNNDFEAVISSNSLQKSNQIGSIHKPASHDQSRRSTI